MNAEELARLRHYYYKLDAAQGSLVCLSDGERDDMRRLIKGHLDHDDPRADMHFGTYLASVTMVGWSWLFLGLAIYATVHGPLLIGPPDWWAILVLTLLCAGLVGIGVRNLIMLLGRRP
jgi:hypothetical protein